MPTKIKYKAQDINLIEPQIDTLKLKQNIPYNKSQTKYYPVLNRISPRDRLKTYNTYNIF